MNPEQSKQMLMSVLSEGRISMNGQPLSGRELMQLQQSVQVLYEGAKSGDESKAEKKPVHPQEKKK